MPATTPSDTVGGTNDPVRYPALPQALTNFPSARRIELVPLYRPDPPVRRRAVHLLRAARRRRRLDHPPTQANHRRRPRRPGAPRRSRPPRHSPAPSPGRARYHRCDVGSRLFASTRPRTGTTRRAGPARPLGRGGATRNRSHSRHSAAGDVAPDHPIVRGSNILLGGRNEASSTQALPQPGLTPDPEAAERSRSRPLPPGVHADAQTGDTCRCSPCPRVFADR